MPVLWDITVFKVKVTVNSFFFLSFLISLPIVIHGCDRFPSVLMIISSSMSTMIEGNKTKYFNS